MVVSDELPKASSKERGGGGGKVNFFFENLSLVPETREVMEHFKLVFGSGTSDLSHRPPVSLKGHSRTHLGRISRRVLFISEVFEQDLNPLTSVFD